MSFRNTFIENKLELILIFILLYISHVKSVFYVENAEEELDTLKKLENNESSLFGLMTLLAMADEKTFLKMPELNVDIQSRDLPDDIWCYSDCKIYFSDMWTDVRMTSTQPYYDYDFRFDREKPSIRKLTFEERQKLYEEIQKFPLNKKLLGLYGGRPKADFFEAFSWCVHAELPNACDDAAKLIKVPSSGSNTPIGTHITSIDGSRKKADATKKLLIEKAQGLKRLSLFNKQQKLAKIAQKHAQYHVSKYSTKKSYKR